MINIPKIKVGIVAVKPGLFPGESVCKQKKGIGRGISGKI